MKKILLLSVVAVSFAFVMWVVVSPRSSSKSLQISEANAKTSVAFRHSSKFDLEHSIKDRIAGEGLADYPGELSELAKISDAAVRRRMIRALVEKWIHDDPENLRKYVKSLDVNNPAAATLLPLLAGAFLDLQPIVSDRLFYAMTQSYGGVDLDAATRWSGQITATGRDVFPCIEMFGKLAKQNPSEAFEMALAIPQNDPRRFVMEHIAANWNFNDPQGAYATAEKLQGPEKQYFYREFFRAWTQADPEKASAALAAMDNPIALAAGAESVAESMVGAAIDARKVLQWADSLPTPESRFTAVNTIYKSWSEHDPLNAATDAYGRYPSNPELAHDLFANAVTGRNDEEIWDMAQKVGDPLKPYALQGSIEQFLQMEPADSVAAKIIALPIGPTKDALAEYAAVQIAQQNPKQATALAQQIGAPALRQDTLNKLTAIVR